jgi:hypothetical protein
MRRRLAKATLALYPVAFRRRYGDEMLALVEDSPTSLRTTTEDHPFSRAGDAHPALGGAHVAIQVLAVWPRSRYSPGRCL